MKYYILINPEEFYEDLCNESSGTPVTFDSGQTLLPILAPHKSFDDYIKYSHEQVNELQSSLYNDNGEFLGEARFPSRKSEEMIRLLKVQAGALNGDS